MLGSQVLVAFVNTTGVAQAFTMSITTMTPSMQQSDLSFGVSSLSATFENDEMTIFGVLEISDENLLSTSQVWQEGPVSNGQLGVHPTTGVNLQSTGSVNFVTGQSGGSSSAGSRTRRRNVSKLESLVNSGLSN